MSRTSGGEQQFFNAKFSDWASARVVNPKNGLRFCNRWFVTHVNRGRPMDIALEPLDQQAESGVRLMLRDPPEQVRMWHPIPDDLVEAGNKVVKVRMRGFPDAGAALQLDSMALFNGDDKERKVDRRLVGVIPLNSNWHEFSVPLRPSGTQVDGQRYLSLRFSGKGVVEIDFCRIDDPNLAAEALSSAKSLVAKVLVGFRKTAPAAPGDDGSLDEEKLVVDPAFVLNAAKVEDIPDVKIEHDALPAVPVADIGSNLLHNAHFQAWSGHLPDLWKVSLPSGASMTRGGASRDCPFKTGNLSLIFDKSVPGQMVSIAQRIPDVTAKRFLDVAVVGQADARTEVEVALIAQSGMIVGGSKATIILWPKWQLRTTRIALPAKLKGEQLAFALFIRGGQGRAIRLAFVAVGVAGQDIAGEFQFRELTSIDSNAVVNGTFDHWVGPLVRPLSSRRLEVTDEWLLTSKSPSPAVEVRVTEISPRGLRDGRDYATVLGLAARGEIVGPYLRMEATLDALQILAGSPRQLRFYARTASTSAPAAAAGQDRPHIEQIFVAERRRISAEGNEFDVKRLFTIRRHVRVGRIGEMQTLPLRADHRTLLTGKAKECLHDAGRSLLLIFEFAGFVDVALADVYFGNNASVPETLAPSIDEAEMEDSNIAGQLALLKGVEHWKSRQALSARPYCPQSPSASRLNWTWLPESRMTVDIVICVYNAIDETMGCLESIYQNTQIPHTITIVDDKSDELTRERLRRYVQGKPWIRLFENEMNLGYTRSANIGMSSSSAEWVVLLNSDTIVTPGWLEGMLEVAKARPNVALVGPLSNAASWQSVPDVHDVKGGWSVNPLPEGHSAADIGRLVSELSLRQFPETTLLNGFCTLMRRDVIEEVGYLDEIAFPMGYGEENDLCLRVRKAGYGLALADHVYVYHVKSASFGSARRAELSKRGTAQLLAKHPDVDMKAVQREMAELTPLMELRKKLRKKLSGGVSKPAGRTVDKPVRAPSPGVVSYQVH